MPCGDRAKLGRPPLTASLFSEPASLGEPGETQSRQSLADNNLPRSINAEIEQRPLLNSDGSPRGAWQLGVGELDHNPRGHGGKASSLSQANT